MLDRARKKGLLEPVNFGISRVTRIVWTGKISDSHTKMESVNLILKIG